MNRHKAKEELIMTKNENVISWNVNYHQSKNLVMNFEQILVGKIFLKEQNDVERLVDDPCLYSLKVSIDSDLEYYSYEV